MQPTSDAYRREITRGHVARTEASLLVDGQPIVDRLTIDEGEVSFDPDAEHRSSANLTLVDDTGTLTPATAADALAAFSAEVAPSRGIRLASGDLETFPLGIFGIDTLDVGDSPAGVRISITGYDRSKQVARNSWDQLWPVLAGQPLETAIHDVVDNRRPGLTYELDSSGHLTSRVIFGDSRGNSGTPWADAQRLATAAGHELYFDRSGALRAHPPAQSNTIAAELVEGADCTILDLGRSFSADEVYNGVIVIGENADTANVRATIWDEDPLSPTYYLGPFGRRPYTHTSPKVRTSEQALAVGRLLLHRMLGAGDSIDLSVTPNAALDPGDLIVVRRRRVGVDAIYRITAMTVPLRYTGTQRLTARLTSLTAA